MIVLDNGERNELYDLSADPYETRDLAKDETERVATLKSLLMEHAEKDRSRAR